MANLIERGKVSTGLSEGDRDYSQFLAHSSTKYRPDHEILK